MSNVGINFLVPFAPIFIIGFGLLGADPIFALSDFKAIWACDSSCLSTGRLARLDVLGLGCMGLFLFEEGL